MTALRLATTPDSPAAPIPVRHGLLPRQVDIPSDSAPIPAVTHDLARHRRRYGPRPAATGIGGRQLWERVETVDLTGCGGGHFPAATKWHSHLDAGGGGTLVANAAESEPASAKDRALLALRPHLVLDGLASVAELLGVEDTVIWTHASAEASRRALRRALAERRAAGLLEPPVRLVTGPDHYLSGESSAILRHLAGGPALPTFRRPGAPRVGADGRPMLVHNVETLARVAQLTRSPRLPYQATTLVTVNHGQSRTVVEADPTDDLDRLIAGVIGTPAQAVLVGGYGGTWEPWTRLTGAPVEHARLRAEHDVDLGAGVLIPVLPGECGLAQASVIATQLAAASAGQCGPCLFGLRSVAESLAEIMRGDGRRRDLPRLQRFLGEISGRGGCHHPDGAVRMVASAAETFADDLESHLRNRACLHPAGPPFVTLRPL